MTKKLLKKRRTGPVKSVKRSTQKSFFKKGKASFGVLAVLVIVISLSAALGLGMLQLSEYDSPLATSYQCCDSGNGDLCKPQGPTITVDLGSGPVAYQLLKTGIKLTEGGGHLQPIPTDKVTGVPANQYVYENYTSQRVWDKYKGECEVHGGVEQDLMDTLFRSKAPGESGRSCEAIPNDEFVYLCRTGCETNQRAGDAAVFDAYFRVSDYPTPGIPNTVKNCQTPEEAEVQQGRQRIINLPSPSGKPNLQLETFYIEQDEVVANWVSPYCKPAVYLYPTIPTDVNVKVYPQGEMLVTIPQYPKNGWDVKAMPNGDIYSGTEKFDYLFYEASIPDELVKLPNEGYVIPFDSLNTFIPELVSKMGLNEKETMQFSEYWLAVLPKSNFYQIKVLSKTTLGEISPLIITPFPKTTIRVTLHFTPLENVVTLPEPNLVTPQRNGFTVVEWGGIFKRDAKHNFSCFM